MKFKGKRTVASQMKPRDNGFKVTADTELMLFMISAMPGKNRNNIKSLLKDKFVEVDGKVQTQFN